MYVLRAFVSLVANGRNGESRDDRWSLISFELYELMYDRHDRGRDAQGDGRVLTYVVLDRRVHDGRRD